MSENPPPLSNDMPDEALLAAAEKDVSELKDLAHKMDEVLAAADEEVSRIDGEEETDETPAQQGVERQVDVTLDRIIHQVTAIEPEDLE